MIRRGTIEAIREAKEFIREPYAWPGGYPKVLYLRTGETICHDCAKENFRRICEDAFHGNGRYNGWSPAGVGILYEGREFCACCDHMTVGAYEDEEDDQ